MERSARLGRAVDPAVRAVFLGNDPRALVPYLRRTDREPGFADELLSGIRPPVLLFAGEHDHERLADLGLRRPSFPTPNSS
jgi:hypothetical protein